MNKIYYNDEDYIPLSKVYDLINEAKECLVDRLKHLDTKDELIFNGSKFIGALEILDSLEIDLSNSFRHTPYIEEGDNYE